MIVTLIGMPGSGKSSVGKLLAARLGFAFVDTDKVIEAERGESLQKVLDGLGSERFLESEAKTVIESLRDATVLAPGGSVVYSEAAMRKVAAESTVVYLHCGLSVFEKRIGGMPRGIVGGIEKTLADLYAERTPLYEKWSVMTVDGEPSAEDVTTDILRLWNFVPTTSATS